MIYLYTIEQALEDTKANFDHLVDTEKTVHAINGFFIKTVTSAMKPLLARRPTDEEKWVIRSRAQVTKLPKQKGGMTETRHRTCTPHRSETNGFAERAVRKIKEGTSAALSQSELDEKWWACPVECCTYLRNVQDLLQDGKTPYERRFGEPF